MTHEEILSMLGDYVDYLIANSSAEAPMWNIEKVRSGKPNKWNYIDGCMITACLSLYKTTGDEKYLKFSKDFIDWFVQEDGSIKTYDPKEYNLDNVNQARTCSSSTTSSATRSIARPSTPSAASCSPSPAPGGQLLAQGHLSVAGLAGRHLHGPAFYMEYETRYNKMQAASTATSSS